MNWGRFQSVIANNDRANVLSVSPHLNDQHKELVEESVKHFTQGKQHYNGENRNENAANIVSQHRKKAYNRCSTPEGNKTHVVNKENAEDLLGPEFLKTEEWAKVMFCILQLTFIK